MAGRIRMEGLTSNGYTYNEAGKPDSHCRRKGVLPDKEKG